MARETYEAQVALLVRVLPHVAGESVFALKGGTAINLFYGSASICVAHYPENGKIQEG